MSFLARFFAPEVAKLNGELNASCLREQWFRGINGELESKLKAAEKALAAEIKRNREREDALLAQILETNGGRRLPVRKDEDEPVQPALVLAEQTLDDIERSLSTLEQQELRDRARQYAEQKGGSADDAYKMFLWSDDPREWLQNY